MTLIWKPGYTTGVKKLDEQHRRMFTGLNGLEEMIAKKTCEGPEVSRLIGSLDKEIGRHFCDEERCMKRSKCPMAEKNEQEHAQYREVHEKFVADFTKKPTVALMRKYHRFAEDWIHQHVAFVDIHLRHHI